MPLVTDDPPLNEIDFHNNRRNLPETLISRQKSLRNLSADFITAISIF